MVDLNQYVIEFQDFDFFHKSKTKDMPSIFLNNGNYPKCESHEWETI